ncbi:Cof-type HAD-IIB family hydrolase [Sphingomonas sp. GC_Shp_4]|uniref:Cof-type HAD-IIB family hydrolase n=1 Tax=Sphingomonas sp. GC_Shp_4 TaxID=2937382 RepID=UPI00226B6442
MSAIKLVVSDVDGTLVDKQKQLTPATIEAVKRLEAAGIGFTVISARPRSGVQPIADALEIDGVIAAFNGGIIFKRDGTVTEHHTIDEAAVRGILALAEGAAVDTWLFADDQWFASTDQGAHVGSERKAANQEPVVDIAAANLAQIDKITFVSDEPQVLIDLKAKIAGFNDQATIAQSQTYYLDVTAPLANKGDGIVSLAKTLGQPMEAIAAIGDQFNDVPMLEKAGFAVVMGNAPDGVKAYADEVTTANDADGVAHAIHTFIFPRLGVPA